MHAPLAEGDGDDDHEQHHEEQDDGAQQAFAHHLVRVSLVDGSVQHPGNGQPASRQYVLISKASNRIHQCYNNEESVIDHHWR